MSEKPMELACTRPRSMRRSLTHRSRKRSVALATAGVPAGPMRDVASRRRRFSTSGRLDKAGRAEQVGLGGKISRVVELDRGGRVDDDVARAHLFTGCIAQTQTITTEVELEHRELRFGQLRECAFPKLVFDSFERWAREDLALEPVRGRSSWARADGQVDATDLGDRAQALLDDRLAEKAGATGDHDGLAP